MQAIILNSGVGSRMGEFTKRSPKCMLEISPGETILSRQIDALLRHNIKSVSVTTGGFHDAIRHYLEVRYRKFGLEFSYIHNPFYRETNYIYSMHLLQGAIESDVILLHGDLVFDAEVFQGFMQAGGENRVLVSGADVFPEKDFKAELTAGRISRIAVDIDRNCKFSLPLYRLSREAMSVWMDQIAAYVLSGRTKVYAEDALNDRLDRIELVPYFFNAGLCQEVDTPEDLQAIQAHFAKI